MDLLGFLRDNWGFIEAAPWSAAACFVFGFAVSWLLARALHVREVRQCEQLVQLATAQSDQAKADAERYRALVDETHQLSPQQLQDKALQVVVELRAFAEKSRKEAVTTLHQGPVDFRLDDDVDPVPVGDKRPPQILAAVSKVNPLSREYAQKYRASVLLIRDELARRITIIDPDEIAPHNLPKRYQDVEAEAAALERLAKSLFG